MSASRLNEVLVALKAIRLEALDTLDDREYSLVVEAQCNEWGAEAARIHLGRWLRDLHDDEDTVV